MATIPPAFVDAAKWVYLSVRGKNPEDDSIDLSTVDIDDIPPGFKAKIAKRIKAVLQARQAWQDLDAGDKTPTSYFPIADARLEFRHPGANAKAIRYAQGLTLAPGTYIGNFAQFTFVNCDLRGVTFFNANMAQCIFYNCTMDDTLDPMRILSQSPGRANLANCVGLSDTIYEELVRVARERTSYRPTKQRLTVGWRMNAQRCSGLQFTFTGEEPAPVHDGSVALGTRILRTVELNGGKPKRTLEDMSAEED